MFPASETGDVQPAKLLYKITEKSYEKDKLHQIF